jgi:hypothetical protein
MAAGDLWQAALAVSPPRATSRTEGVVGLAALRDPCLGDALFLVRNHGRCARVRLEGMSRAVAEASLSEAESHDRAALNENLMTSLGGMAHHRQSGAAAEMEAQAEALAWRSAWVGATRPEANPESPESRHA